MRYFWLAIMALSALVLQGTVFSFLAIGSVKPDLLLIFVIFFGLFQGPVHGAVYGLTCGLLQDLFLGQFIGMNAMLLMLAGYLTGLLERKIYKENLIVPVLLLLVATFLKETGYLLLINLFGMDFSFEQGVALIAKESFYNVFIGSLVYNRFHRAVTKGCLRSKQY